MAENGRQLKLDLHTHCGEALNFATPDVEVVRRIVEMAKSRGLDGIAITEHDNKDYGDRVKAVVDQHFAGELLIIPGCEHSGWPRDIVELYLPDGAVFRFWAHPGYPATVSRSDNLANLHGIEIANGLHDADIDKNTVREMSLKHGLLLLTDSDAHDLKDIGRYYNEVSLEDLSLRARKRS